MTGCLQNTAPGLHVYFSEESVEVSCHRQLPGEQAEAQRLKTTTLKKKKKKTTTFTVLVV